MPEIVKAMSKGIEFPLERECVIDSRFTLPLCTFQYQQ
ncbi:hypothetical protein JCM19235_2909 [Vibrio maritimus]|uniref:Uncharacterized protein n=1 Tax=Vibrio maritimus TaxID=990268 RepID=A0A090S6S0_9VIBR|nr:hypothetical protein JCM19235_2909 [Vibrio maritimus]